MDRQLTEARAAYLDLWQRVEAVEHSGEYPQAGIATLLLCEHVRLGENATVRRWRAEARKAAKEQEGKA